MREPIRAHVRGRGVVEIEPPDLPHGHAAGQCVHFTGIFGPGMVRHKHCAAGVEYDAVTVDHDRTEYTRDGVRYFSTRSRPCSLVLDYCGAQCEKRQWPTLEEIAQHKAYTTALLANVKAALASRADAAHTPTTEE